MTFLQFSDNYLASNRVCCYDDVCDEARLSQRVPASLKIANLLVHTVLVKVNPKPHLFFLRKLKCHQTETS